jgi:hypothetical protein
VLVGEGAELKQGGVGEDVGVGDAGVVDFGDVDDVVDWGGVSLTFMIWRGQKGLTNVTVLEGDLISADHVVDRWHNRSVKVLRARLEISVLLALEERV